MKIVAQVKEMAEAYAVLGAAFERTTALVSYLQSEAPVKMEFPFITAYHCGWGPLFTIDEPLRREVFHTLRRLFAYDSDPAVDEPSSSYAVPDHLFGMVLRGILEQIRLMRARAEAEDSDVEVKSMASLDIDGLRGQTLSIEIIPKEDLIELLTKIAVFESHSHRTGMSPDARRWVDLNEIERTVNELGLSDYEVQTVRVDVQAQSRDRFGVLVKIILPEELRSTLTPASAGRSSFVAEVNASLIERLGGIFQYPSLSTLVGGPKTGATTSAAGSAMGSEDAKIQEMPISLAQMLEIRSLPHQLLGNSILRLRYLIRLRPDVVRSLKNRFPRGRAYDPRVHADVFAMLNQNMKMNGRYLAMLFSNFLTNRRLRAEDSLSFLALEYHFRMEAFRKIEERFEKEFHETIDRLENDPPSELPWEEIELRLARMRLLVDVPKGIVTMVELLRKGHGERVLRMLEEMNEAYRKFGNIELPTHAPSPPSAQPPAGVRTA